MKIQISTLVTLAVCALGSPSLAADIAARVPVKAPPVASSQIQNWTGFYMGAHAGYGSADATTTPDMGFFLGDPRQPYRTMNGALAGGQLGFNYQINQFLIGIEGDGSWADLKRHTLTSIYPPNTTTDSGEVEWIASIRGRVGIAFDSLLLYGTGGASWASLKLSTQTLFNPGALVARNRADNGIVHNGWVVGGGLEWAFAPKWTARVEYLHYEFEAAPHFSTNSAFGTPADLRMDVVRAGVSYKFGG